MDSQTPSEVDWHARFRAADDLYTTEDCGCLRFVVVDLAEEVRDAHDIIVRESLAGHTLKRCKRRELPPLYCSPEHRAARSSSKVETATGESAK